MHFILIFLMFALWTSIFPLGKILLQECPPVFLTALRMLLAGAVITGFLGIRKKENLVLTGRQWLSIFFFAFFSIYLTNVSEFWGLNKLTAAKTCFIYSLSPFFAAFLSYLHFKEKLTLKKCLGILLGVAGMLPVFLSRSLGAFSFADLAVVGAALFSVYGWVLLRVLVKDKAVSPLTANGLGMLLGGSMALIHSTLVDVWQPTPLHTAHPSAFFGLLALATLISNIICYNLYGHLLKRFTATFLSFAGLLSPVFTSISSWLLIGEPFSWLMMGALACVSLGLWIVYHDELKQGYLIKMG